MPLLDHFHPPLAPTRRWESFHTQWATSIARTLNRTLPSPRYFAEVQAHLGAQVESDVAEFENRYLAAEAGNGAPGSVAVQTETLPAVTAAMPAQFPDDIEVLIQDSEAGRLVAVVELISPRNKDRAEARRAFAVKTAAYLQRGVGVVVADVVTSRRFNLHNELVALLQLPGFARPDEEYLYAVAYRPARREDSNWIDFWWRPLAVGEKLPELPLALRGSGCIRLDLEATYTDARQGSGLP